MPDPLCGCAGLGGSQDGIREEDCGTGPTVLGLTKHTMSRTRQAIIGAAAVLAGLLGCGREGGHARLYVTSGFTDQVLVLDAGSGEILDSIATDPRTFEVDEPHGIAISPDGSTGYVSVSHGEPTLWAFRTSTHEVIGQVGLGIYGAGRVGVTPDGRRAIVPDYYRSGQGVVSSIAVVDLERLDVLTTLEVCPAPHDAQVSPDGRWVALTCSLGDEIVVLDARSLSEIHRWTVDSLGGPPGAPRFKPLNLVWTPNGDRLFVTMHNAGLVRGFTPDGQETGSVEVGAGPAQIAVSPDGRTLVVPNRGDRSLSIVDAATLTERARVELGVPHPHGVALSADGQLAFVTTEGDTESLGSVVAVEVHSGDIVWRTTAGSYTLGIAYWAPPPGS